MPNYSGNIPGVTPQARSGLSSYLTSPQQAMHTFGRAATLQQAPGPGAGSSALIDAYRTTPFGSANPYTPNPLETPNSPYTQWNQMYSTLYGNRPWDQQPGNASGSTGNNGNGGGAGNGGSGGTEDTVTSTITPRPVFSPEQTESAISSAAAQAFMAGDPRLLQGGITGGRSRDAGTLSAVMPAVASAENAAATAAQAIPINDFGANQRSILQGQAGRAGESLGLANILSQLRAAQQNNAIQQQSMLMPLISAGLGM